MLFAMLKKSVNIGLLSFISLFLAVLLLSLALQNIQAALFLLLISLATPFIFIVLKTLTSAWKNTDRSHKLKTRF